MSLYNITPTLVATQCMASTHTHTTYLHNQYTTRNCQVTETTPQLDLADTARHSTWLVHSDVIPLPVCPPYELERLEFNCWHVLYQFTPIRSCLVICFPVHTQISHTLFPLHGRKEKKGTELLQCARTAVTSHLCVVAMTQCMCASNYECGQVSTNEGTACEYLGKNMSVS